MKIFKDLFRDVRGRLAAGLLTTSALLTVGGTVGYQALRRTTNTAGSNLVTRTVARGNPGSGYPGSPGYAGGMYGGYSVGGRGYGYRQPLDRGGKPGLIYGLQALEMGLDLTESILGLGQRIAYRFAGP